MAERVPADHDRGSGLVVSARVARWKAAWESRDPAEVVRLYAPDATHSSHLVPTIYPEIGGTTLTGAAQIHEYARRGLARFTSLRFELLTVTETTTRSAVEFLRYSSRDAAPTRGLELIEWDGDVITSVRVFHA